MALFDYYGGAKKRKEQIDETLQEGSTPKPSVRAQQPKVKAAPKGPAVNKGKKCPMWVRAGDCARLGYTSK